jgi:hypothetical protein
VHEKFKAAGNEDYNEKLLSCYEKRDPVKDQYLQEAEDDGF